MAALNPPPAEPGRRDGLAGSQARLRLPRQTVIRQLSNAFETAIARALKSTWIGYAGTSCNTALVRTSSFPTSPVWTETRKSILRALATNQLAGVLADLGLIRPLGVTELKRFGREETQPNMSDLQALERHHARTMTAAETSRLPGRAGCRQATINSSTEMTRHGLLALSGFHVVSPDAALVSTEMEAG